MMQEVYNDKHKKVCIINDQGQIEIVKDGEKTIIIPLPNKKFKILNENFISKRASRRT